MPKPAAPSPAKPVRGSIEYDLARLATGRDALSDFARAPLPDLEGARSRILAGWRAHEPAFRAALREAGAHGRALWEAAREYVDAGLPREPRPADTHAALYVAARHGGALPRPTPGDFGALWLAAGDLGAVVEVALRAGALESRMLDTPERLVLADLSGDAHALAVQGDWRLLTWLSSPLAEAPPDAKLALRDRFVERVRALPPVALASFAVGLRDSALAREAAERIVAYAAEQPRSLLPIHLPLALLDAIDAPAAFAALLRTAAPKFQYFGVGYVARAVKRFAPADGASALLAFFEAMLADPTRADPTSVRAFATVAACVDDPRLAAFFRAHARHKWFARAAATHAARFGSPAT